MNTKYYDLPKPETIRRFTVSVKAGIGTSSKVKLRNIDMGLTANGAPRQLPFRPRKNQCAA